MTLNMTDEEILRLRDRVLRRPPPAGFFDIVFDGPPGPVSGRFVEVEDESGASINVGEWVERPDGFWVLRIAR